MPKLLYTIKTPLGEFASSGDAAKAHQCDRSTIMNRIQSRPTEYQKIPKPPAPKKVRKYKPVSVTTWPLTWYQYKYLSHEVKEQIYHSWCENTGQDPDAEATVDAFFDTMDQTPETEDDEQQVI